MVHTGPMPDSKDKTLAESASPWMQVVFGGLGVCIAIVALVIAYFAWVQPQSPNNNDEDPADPPPGPAATATTRTDVPVTAAPSTAAGVSLSELTPTVGAGNVRRSGDDLVIHCATGQSDDRLRKVEYDLLGRYTGMDAELRVSKARDSDTPLQLKVFADGPEAANKVVTKGKTTRLSISLEGRQKVQVQLTCQFPDGEITLGSPKLIHA
jgi:hypothetical protein